MNKKCNNKRLYSNGGWMYNPYVDKDVQTALLISLGLRAGSLLTGIIGEAKGKLNLTKGGFSGFDNLSNIRQDAKSYGINGVKDLNTVDKSMGNLLLKPMNFKYGGQLHEYAGGGTMDQVSAWMDIAADVSDLYAKNALINTAAVNAAKANTARVYESSNVTSNNFDSLMSDWANASRAKTDYTRKGMQGDSSFKKAMNSVTGSIGTSMKGFQATGNWVGAVIGGVAGLAGGLFGMGSAKRKARKLARTANMVGRNVNQLQQDNFIGRSNLLDALLDRMNAASYAAFGGPVYTPNSAIGYSLANDLLYNDYMKTMALQRLVSMPNSLLEMKELNTFADGGSIYIKPSKRGTFTAAAKSRDMGVLEFASKVLANKENYSPAMVKKANFARNASKWHAFGGSLQTHGGDWTNGLTWFDNGGTHEENPYNGIPLGIAPDGLPNLVEEGEVKYNNYIFSNRLKVQKLIQEKYKLKDGTTHALAIKKLSKESEERPNDAISQNGLDAVLEDLYNDLEEVREKKELRRMRKLLNKLSAEELLALQELINPLELYIEAAYGGHLHKFGDWLKETNPELYKNRKSITKEDRKALKREYKQSLLLKTEKEQNTNVLPTLSRYAPLFDYAEAPGYSALLYMQRPNYRTAAFNRTGQYLIYRPFDSLYAINLLLSNANASRNAIRNTAGGNRALAMANLALLNALALNILGQTLLGADKENLARYNQVIAANNALDMLNAEMALKADMANMDINKLEAQRAYQLAALAHLIEEDIVGARNATRTNRLQTLANIGRENQAYNMANSNMALDYISDPTGVSRYRRSGKNGGYLTIKKKRR